MPDPTITQSTPKPSKSKVQSIAPAGSDLESLADLNSKYVFVKQLAQVVRIPTESHPDIDPYHPTTFASALEARRGTLARRWLGWAGRNEVYKLTYSPGCPQIHEGNLNTWIAPRCKAKKGNVDLWSDYLERIFRPDPTYRDWFEHWLAYPIQFPGTKQHTAVLFWSEQTGTGKSMLGRIMRELYGPTNYAQINESSLHGQFNHWAAGRQFIMGEEIRGRDAQKHADALKAMITQQTVFVNIKNRAHYELTDCLNYYFTSNHAEAFYLDPHDRRFFVHNIGEERYPAEKYRDEFEPWFYRAGGAQAIRYHLEHLDLRRPILGGNPNSPNPAPFNPGSPAPQTAARAAMISASRSPIDYWWDEFTSSLSDDNPGVFTMEFLYDLYTTSEKRAREGKQQFTRKIKPRMKELAGGNPVTLNNCTRSRLYLVQGRVSSCAGQTTAAQDSTPAQDFETSCAATCAG
jgi:Family of unknown function (DUF5906)